MLFTEYRFLVFFAVAFAVHWLLKSNTVRKRWLLVCSYVFYGAWDWRFCSLIAFSTVVDYFAGSFIEAAATKARKKLWLTLSLVTNLGLLGVFKYYDFFRRSGEGLFDLFGMEFPVRELDIILPVGISFYTFQTISYTIDIYRGGLKPIRSFLDFAFFVSFFPQLVAGPIVRAVEFLPQLETTRVFKTVDVRACLTLFMIGFVKKACIADNLAPYVDQFFAHPQAYTVDAAWRATMYHIVQFYCDFSGYSDMAIASAGLLGYTLPENFRFPYFSRNIDLFWRRWHISMSSWFRDYIFLPLSRVRKGRKYVWQNLLIAFCLIGLWHGAAWNFVVFGFMHGCYLTIHGAWKLRVPQASFLGKLSRAIGHPITFLGFVPTVIVFRAIGTDTTLDALRAVVLFDSPGKHEIGTPFWLIMPSLALVHWITYKGWVAKIWRRLPGPVAYFILGCWAALALQWAAREYQAFIYFQF